MMGECRAARCRALYCTVHRAVFCSTMEFSIVNKLEPKREREFPAGSWKNREFPFFPGVLPVKAGTSNRDPGNSMVSQYTGCPKKNALYQR